MKHTLTWNRNGYQIDGVETPLVSGEFHYFRVPYEAWKERLILLKESGANAVATYIPWIIHEPEEGNIVFDDCPQRELGTFLKLCDELDLMVIARPGPYQYAELVCSGLPVWLFDSYPEIHAQFANGTNMASGTVSYLHPTFLEKARKYIAAADAMIRPFLVTNGGPIVSVQIDNELSGIHVWKGSLDYNPIGMGYGREDGIYPTFLKEKYGTVAAMNEAYGTAYDSFCAVNPATDARDESTLCGQRFVADYSDAYTRMIETYACTVAAWFREDGIDVPLCTNCASINEAPYLHRLPQMLSTPELPFLMGVDLYYTLSPAWEDNPTPQNYLRWMAALDLMNEMGMPPTVFELQGGTLSDYPPMQEECLSAFYFALNALGTKGANYYIFAGGPNFGITGSTGDIYDYHAAIGCNGEIRPHYYCQKERNEHTLARPWMQKVERSYNVQLGFVWEQRRRDKYAPRFGRDGIRLNQYIENLQFTILGCGYHPRYRELGNELNPQKPLILPCDGRMSAEKQQAVIRFLEQGGRLLITPFVPELDEDFNPCTLLKDYIGMGEIAKIDNPQSRAILNDGTLIYGIPHTYTCDSFGGEVVLRTHVTDQPVARVKNVGNGKVLWLGIEYTYSLFSQNTMMEHMLRLLGEEPAAQCSNTYLWSTVFEDGEHAICYAVNLLAGKQKASLKVKANGVWHDLGELEVPGMTTLAIDL